MRPLGAALLALAVVAVGRAAASSSLTVQQALQLDNVVHRVSDDVDADPCKNGQCICLRVFLPQRVHSCCFRLYRRVRLFTFLQPAYITAKTKPAAYPSGPRPLNTCFMFCC
jgi:hypothetical protein